MRSYWMAVWQFTDAQLKINLIPNKNSFECGPTRADFRWFPSDVSFQSVDWVNSALKVNLKVSIGWICERGRHDANSWLEWMKSNVHFGWFKSNSRSNSWTDGPRTCRPSGTIHRASNWIESNRVINARFWLWLNCFFCFFFVCLFLLLLLELCFFVRFICMKSQLIFVGFFFCFFHFRRPVSMGNRILYRPTRYPSSRKNSVRIDLRL